MCGKWQIIQLDPLWYQLWEKTYDKLDFLYKIAEKLYIFCKAPWIVFMISQLNL